MKKHQIKSIAVSLILILLSIGFRYLIKEKMQNNWSHELTNLVCVESVIDTLTTEAIHVSNQRSRIEKKTSKKRVFINKKIQQQPKKPIAKVNINIASVEQFKSLPGIGEVLSTRIVKYRERLGGFHCVDQIKEVYGLPEETVFNNMALLTCSGSIKLLALHSMTFKEILSHPYFDYEQTKAVKNFIGKYKLDSKATLRRITGADQLWTNKVWAYIDRQESINQALVVEIEKENTK